MMKEKSIVDDIDRSVYDIRDEEHDAYRMEAGLTPKIVDKLSKEKNDPIWMQQFRLQSLQIYNEMSVPNWGPSIEGLDMDHIATYVRPKTDMKNDWKDVPQDIKDTFDRLGIPKAERKSLAGVGAQYDSELVYHNVKEEVAAQGVVYTDMESALKGEYADMVRKYFMKLVTPRDHKFAALHGAVWSGGSCQSLMLDSESRSDTIPAMDIRTRDASIGHEAKIGSISNDAIFYLMSRGMSEEDARALIVSGFADNVSKELPVEYAVEMNNLIRLEMKGSIG